MHVWASPAQLTIGTPTAACPPWPPAQVLGCHRKVGRRCGGGWRRRRAAHRAGRRGDHHAADLCGGRRGRQRAAAPLRTAALCGGPAGGLGGAGSGAGRCKGQQGEAPAAGRPCSPAPNWLLWTCLPRLPPPTLQASLQAAAGAGLEVGGNEHRWQGPGAAAELAADLVHDPVTRMFWRNVRARVGGPRTAGSWALLVRGSGRCWLLSTCCSSAAVPGCA